MQGQIKSEAVIVPVGKDSFEVNYSVVQGAVEINSIMGLDPETYFQDWLITRLYEEVNIHRFKDMYSIREKQYTED